MTVPTARAQLPDSLEEVLAHATGKAHRADPHLPGTGGPAGNAQLTAWIGLVLLALSLAELVTLISVRSLISWHIVVGVLLIPPALVKTGTTGWRLVRYYTGSGPYVQAGPPPLLLRLLGPLVVVSTLTLLATGVTLVGLGQQASYRPWFTVLGHEISWLTAHQASFIGWAVATGLHVLGRLVPAVRLSRTPAGERRDGTALRLLVMGAMAVTAVVLAWFVLGLSGSWTSDSGFRSRPDGLGASQSAGLR